MTVLGGLQFKKVSVEQAKSLRFNTDDGIRRAAIQSAVDDACEAAHVSIPMTVLGGLQ